MRFNEVLRSIAGTSRRMLTLRLKALDRDGLVRRVFATIPPKVEYKLTALDRSLLEPVRTLIDWTQKNQAKVEAARAALDAGAGDAADMLQCGIISRVNRLAAMSRLEKGQTVVQAVELLNSRPGPTRTWRRRSWDAPLTDHL